MANEKIYNKLVRDNIPEIMSNKGLDFTTHIALKEEYENKIFEKLSEEIFEFKEDKSVEEMADIMEVLLTICRLYNIDATNLESVRIKKEEERGSFKERIILEKVIE